MEEPSINSLKPDQMPLPIQESPPEQNIDPPLNQDSPHSPKNVDPALELEDLPQENPNKESEDLNKPPSKENVAPEEEASEENKEEGEMEEVEIEEEISLPEEEFQVRLKEYEEKKLQQEGKPEEEKEVLEEPTQKQKIKKIIRKPKDNIIANEVVDEDSESKSYSFKNIITNFCFVRGLVINYIKERLEEELDKFSEDMWSKTCNGFIHDFIKDTYKLLFLS